MLWCPKHPPLSPLGYVLQGSTTIGSWPMKPLSAGCLICVLRGWAPKPQISLWNMPLATPGAFGIEKRPFLYLEIGAHFSGEFSAHRLLQITKEPEWVWPIQQIWVCILSGFSPHYSNENKWNEVWESRDWEFFISHCVYHELNC